MTQEQESFAERIIGLHKEKSGYLDWNTIYYIEDSSLFNKAWSDREKSNQIELVKNTLEELQLVVFTNADRDRSTLTQVGYAYKGFAQERKKADKKEKEERMTSWPQRKWYLYGAINYIGGIATLFLVQLVFPKSNTQTEIKQTKSNVSTYDTTQKNASYNSILNKPKK